MTSIKELLELAWTLIEDPKNRCVGSYALDSNNIAVPSADPSAVCFCSTGALRAADARNNDPDKFFSSSAVYYRAYDLLKEAAKELTARSHVEVFNDADVLNNPPKLYARAIELASERE